jgi:hypothetical protein
LVRPLDKVEQHVKGFRPERTPFLSLAETGIVNIEDKLLESVEFSLPHSPSGSVRRKIAEKLQNFFIDSWPLLSFCEPANKIAIEKKENRHARRHHEHPEHHRGRSQPPA